MMEIQETSRWEIRRVQDEENGYWLPERQLYTVVRAHCDAHSLQTVTVENWSMLHPEESAQRWADKHNEACHPRQLAKRRRREEILNEVVGPLVRELSLDPVDPDTDQWGDAPLLGFDPGVEALALFNRTTNGRVFLASEPGEPIDRDH